ncbi:hypothetical protein Desde_0322 [Desulfitobacterium dehalogenans ATCC 51507]|uniref:DUF4956 domain-containing protein n=1 Tax=Desulfitobacterium dehalogenans (strain ATCC 51507 / DSM 9161 / JW/IU-DC1) TaxID=756499 RepID=I4A4A8_DESDJ|nr:DUF4956 domain-containing protein [Desulfitobacterium dehalogenans]AFL98792.1 hypothetical protein Desde_0322 [Desulfitobacterium dehalogenans ATCC 51507]
MKDQLLAGLEASTGALTLQDILLNFLIAGILGVVIFISYRISHSGAVYSAKFNVSLIMLTLVTTLVMNVIGNNIALSLGMVGALSIVRFRTAIKDPRDTAYIFWGIAVGVCCGVQEYLLSAIGSGIIFLFMLMFGAVKSNDRYLLVLRGESVAEQALEKAIDQIFGGKAQFKVKNTSNSFIEHIYELSQKQVQQAEKQIGSLTSYLNKIEGMTAVNLISQNDEINR